MNSVEVPTQEAFNELATCVNQLKDETGFLKSLLLGERWLSRKQALQALGCKDDKLKRLATNKVLTVRYEGIKPYYDVFSIRAYLTVQRVDAAVIDRRILTAKYRVD